ncbi:MAG TPA: acyl-CoA dehydrogenase [Casimicrobiaceae bacterium]|jgi:alkylation response protein AidB-like acyl-CoA dehydrogenase|nr:acyl-CoA dehydrogenase [Casimicrobiaceae bacterium]
MNLDPSEEQRLLAASIERFVERDYAFDTRRRIVASSDGHSEDVWRTMAELGLLGLPLPVAHGGFGGGAMDTVSLMEAIGGALIVEPWLATVALGAQFIARGGNNELRDEQRRRILPAVAEGRLKLAFAHAEGPARHTLAHVATRARADADGWVISGIKRAVAHAACADLLVVSARTDGGDNDVEGLSLFVVERDAPGIALTALRMLDGTRAADIKLDEVRVPLQALIGAPDRALPLIEEVVDFATALVCAEAVGAIRSANDATLEYLKTRKQFGVAIGSFQALQHRMVDLAIEYEQAKSIALLACSVVDSERDAAARLRTVSAAKARIADACRKVSQESIQLHGGMGMSDEVKVSHTFRRLTAIAQQFGDADHHLARFAALS